MPAGELQAHDPRARTESERERRQEGESSGRRAVRASECRVARDISGTHGRHHSVRIWGLE